MSSRARYKLSNRLAGFLYHYVTLRKDQAEIKNQAESLIYATEKTKEDLKDKITEEQKNILETFTKN